MAGGGKELEKAQAGQLATLAELGGGDDYREALGQDDMSIPFISILQPLSPQCVKGEAEFIKGAEPSMLFNSVTRETFITRDEDDNVLVGMQVIALAYKASFVEWVPREKGGGFVAEYSVAEGNTIRTQRDERNRDIIVEGSTLGKPGNQLAYTHSHFVFVVRNGRLEPGVITMSSTQIKPSKDWNFLVSNLRLPQGQTAPRFYGVWGVKTRRRSNQEGTWFVFDIQQDGTILDIGGDVLTVEDIIAECKSFVDGINTGRHTIDRDKEAAAGANPTVDAGAGGGADAGDVPF